ncbi:MAG: hypothetical protein ACFFD1_11250, partial [Candidatus Thorarchaeota archaeon]
MSSFQRTKLTDSNRTILSYKRNDFRAIISLQDNILSKFWNYIFPTEITEFSSPTGENGWIKTIYDAFYIYFAIKFYKKTDWVAIDLTAKAGNENSMAYGDDGFLLYSNQSKGGGDIFFVGIGSTPQTDYQNDVSYEIISGTNDFSYIEVKRPLITNDPSGFDVDFVPRNNYSLKFSSNSRPQTHYIGVREVYTLFLSDLDEPFSSIDQTISGTNITTNILSMKF